MPGERSGDQCDFHRLSKETLAAHNGHQAFISCMAASVLVRYCTVVYGGATGDMLAAARQLRTGLTLAIIAVFK
jgi:cobalamin synthase